ncbi:MAG: Sec-independent protein translocase subunit TatA [Nocardioidaceae bacterium]
MNLAVPFANGLGGPEIIILILVVMLLFGGKKLPELARGSGRALRIFKAETKGLMTDDKDDDETTSTAAQLPPVAQPTSAPPPVATAQEPVIKDLQNPDNSR